MKRLFKDLFFFFNEQVNENIATICDPETGVNDNNGVAGYSDLGERTTIHIIVYK